MTQHWQASKTTIQQLHLTNVGDDPLLARLRLSTILNGSSLRPAGLPPSAILCIRHVSDPLPGTLNLSSGSFRPPPTWDSAIQNALSRYVQQAVRPMHGAILTNAPAVIFADHAELLACLALALLIGELPWWAQTLYPDLTSRSTLVTIWAESAPYIPATLEQLSKRQRVVAFINTLASSEAQTLLRAVLRSFTLDPLRQALEAPLDANERQSMAVAEAGLTVESSKQPLIEDTLSAALYPAAPWEHWIVESRQVRLAPDARALLGLGLMLQRAISDVRTPTFVRAVRRWVLVTRHATELPTRSSAIASSRASISLSRSAIDLPSDVTTSNAINRPSTLSAQPPMPPSVADSSTSETVAPISFVEPSAKPSSASASQSVREPETTSHPEPISTSLPVDSQIDEPAAYESILEALIETNYGGLMYLINIALYLDLYGDFTQPQAQGIGLQLWDYLALIGDRWLGDALHEDPLWGLLGRLAGRDPQQPPGADFTPLPDWRIPVEWLATFETRIDCQWRVAGDRLVVMHPASFWLVDIPATDDVNLQLSSILSEYNADLNAVHAEIEPPDGEVGSLDRWLAWLLSYFQARLRQALHIDDQAELVRVLLYHRAKISISGTHIDVVFSLDTLPISIRLAGLDRNPDWVPATGRIIRFHFN